MKFNKSHTFRNTSGSVKLLFSIGLALLAYLIMAFFKIDVKSNVVLSWDAFCLSMIIISWTLFFSTSSEELCDVVEEQDDGLKVIFLIVIVAVCFSLFGAILLLLNKEAPTNNRLFHTIVSISPVVLSWFLLHTAFTVRYAHLYHDHDKLKTGSVVGGIDFPSKKEPDYVDFAYFSFTIGMTFQVSDAQVSSAAIRRFVLLHGLIAFVFNTTIVALTINTIAGLQQ